MKKPIKALQALHDTPPLCLFLLLHIFWHKKISNVTTRFDQIHQLFHKILSINIILKSIMGHNCVEKFGKIMCISHNMDHISMHKQNFIKIHSLHHNLFITLLLGSQPIVSYPNRVILRVKCIGYIGKWVINSHLGSNPNLCYIQNRVIMNRVIKRFRCILKIEILAPIKSRKLCWKVQENFIS